MNNISKIIKIIGLSFTELGLLSISVNAFDFYFEGQTNDNYTYTITLDNDDSLSPGDRLILTNLTGVTNASANSPYSIEPEDFNDTSANFIVDTPLSGANTLTGVISLTSADSLDNLEYQAFYSDNGTFRVASNTPVAVPFGVSPNLGIMLILGFMGLHKFRKTRKSIE